MNNRQVVGTGVALSALGALGALIYGAHRSSKRQDTGEGFENPLEPNDALMDQVQMARNTGAL